MNTYTDAYSGADSDTNNSAGGAGTVTGKPRDTKLQPEHKSACSRTCCGGLAPAELYASDLVERGYDVDQRPCLRIKIRRPTSNRICLADVYQQRGRGHAVRGSYQ